HAVLKAHNVGLTIDPEAQARLKQPRLHTNLVLYAEDLTADDLVKLLQQLGAEDRKAEAKKRGDGQFDALVLTRMGKEDRKELSELLGVDPKQVTQTLSGQGSTPRPDPNKPAAKAPDVQALVLPYNPVRPRPGSAEVKRFLEARKQPRTGAVQLLLVLRE